MPGSVPRAPSFFCEAAFERDPQGPDFNDFQKCYSILSVLKGIFGGSKFTILET